MVFDQLPVDPADRTVTISSADFKLLTDVYSHIAEYAATKDKNQVDAAVRIVDASNPAPWISSVHLQDFMQKKWVIGVKAKKAVEEFCASYPHMNPKGLEEDEGWVLAMASIYISKHPDAFDLSWNVLRRFLPNLITNYKTMGRTVDSTAFNEAVDAAIRAAYKDAAAKVEAEKSTSTLSISSETETPNADVEATSGGEDEPNNDELVEDPKVHEKTKESKKRHNRATGDEESGEPKRRKVNRRKAKSTMGSHRVQKLSAEEIMEEELKEQRQQFMSKLDKQPPGSQPGLFLQAMLRLCQHGPIANLLEVLQTTSSEENID
ncbi:hypothetical protein LX32DRAFT_698618 [Colletotrichum zoysiae]|uniref:Uncharacterized protein n=1 Tax=Colletotrichum zoysiae TaxID=1216348 RepID=A0AAD9LY91_9PEZI|nr:hypothetical protein LX32DRAFT_698618 [Colletotrichum zoysiae]